MASVTFSTSLGGNGQTITDDADPNTGLAAGGHRVRFISALSGAVDMAATSVAKAQEAEDFKNLCQQLRDEAETFRDQASTSEDNAATSATLSEDWATKLSTPVDGSEYSSKYYANESSESASNAEDSANAASASEANAATSESNALTSANNASTSESNAATSEGLAEDWATKTSDTVDGVEYSAKYYSEQASSDAMSAGGFAGDAENSANNAAQSESNAQNSEDAAALSALNSSDSENAASGYAQTAQGYAEDAAQSAASVDADNIVHAPGSGLPNEAGTAYGKDIVTDPDDDTSNRLVTNARLSKVVSGYVALPPGPQELIAGDMLGGFFGEVPSSDLFTNSELDFLLGFTEGSPMNDSAWLKFARDGSIIYVQKRPMRHSISWDHIYSRGCVYGTNDEGLFPRGTPTNQYRPLYKDGLTFIPRLLTGAASDPINTTNFDAVDSCTYDLGSGSEWNELIYRVHQDVPICDDPNHDQYHGGPQVGGNWATYTDGDLGIASGNGRATWTQEQASDSTSRRVRRGAGASVAYFFRPSASNAGSYRGLRLVLALDS